jgi:hypothetical protein
MPYVLRGKTVYKKMDGGLKKKATAHSVASAKRMMRLLRGVEHGMKVKKK